MVEDFNPAYLESILITIRIFAIPNEGVVRLGITDNGLGIDLALHGHKLFGRDKALHRHPDARGKGLFLVKIRSKRWEGGKISTDSSPGHGTIFAIEFN